MKDSVEQLTTGCALEESPLEDSSPETPQDDEDLATEAEIEEESTTKNKSSFKTKFWKWCFWSGAFIATATISAVVGATIAMLAQPPQFSSFLKPKSFLVSNSDQKADDEPWGALLQYNLARPVNILVMGIDRVPDADLTSTEVFDGRSDTMLLLRFDPTDHSLRMLSIPRDTRVEFDELEIPKINQANADGGPSLAARVVSKTLNNVRIDRYLRVTTDAFVELVDLVGGVEVYVPERMSYVDMTQKLEIDLEPGWQTLYGEEAEQFARFRNDRKGDIGRVQRQQILLNALKKRLQNPAILPRLPKAVRIVGEYLDTNLSTEEMLALVSFALDLERDDLKMVMLPGRFSEPDEYRGSYWIMSESGRDRIMREYFDIYADNSDESENFRRPVTRVRIAIQNATDDPEVIYRVADYLEEKEFFNLYFVSDSSQTLMDTEIIAQKGDLEAANTLKKVFGLGSVEANSTGDLDSDLTIKVGQDLLTKLSEDSSDSSDSSAAIVIESEKKQAEVEAESND
ncbi:MAG: LCP family protein [Oscillatoria sp. PMC 1068.18]|nr:LCP family protein [Oscillatoria sp. PMC 1076.18]MEC4991522.1 LCP family protein [Oscillatoria sp. PMC 1068.18]